LALWLAADVAVATDEKQRVIAWPDILYGDNRSAEDAIQDNPEARPLLVADAVHGHPAIRFDGKADYLLTTPFETTDDQTVMFVCQFSQSAYDPARVWGGQIINYDGPPSRYLSNTLEPGVLQIGEPLLATEFKPTLLTGQVFAGFVGSATVEAGRIDADQVGADVPVVVAYRYDYTGGKSELFINGRSYGQARAFAPQGITSRKIIGRHSWMQLFYHGDLAEMLIYNKALSAQELADATAYLAGKYAIELAGKSTSAANEDVK
jgi:concanavalin A-like lectin/glucanase superfamily protein